VGLARITARVHKPLSRGNTFLAYTIGTAIAVCCLCLIAHTATDLADLNQQVSPQHVRLEPPEHGQVATVVHRVSDLTAGSPEDGSNGIPASPTNLKDLDVKLRI
jgi:hypothetical protein